MMQPGQPAPVVVALALGDGHGHGLLENPTGQSVARRNPPTLADFRRVQVIEPQHAVAPAGQRLDPHGVAIKHARHPRLINARLTRLLRPQRARQGHNA